MEILDDIEIQLKEEKASPWLILIGFFVGLLLSFLAFAFLSIISQKGNFLDKGLYELPVGYFALGITLMISHLCFLFIARNRKQNKFIIFLSGIPFSLFMIYSFVAVVTIFSGENVAKFIEGLTANDVLTTGALNYLNFIFCTFLIRWNNWKILIGILSILSIGLMIP